LHVHEMPLTLEGVTDFIWPVSRDELWAVCLEASYAVTAMLREGLRLGGAGAQELSIISNQIAAEILSWYSVQAAYTRLLAAGRTPVIPERLTIWRFLAGESSGSLALDPYSMKLQQAFPQKSFIYYLQKPWKQLRKRLAALGSSSGPEVVAPGMEFIIPPKDPRSIHSRRISSRRLREGIVTTKRGDILSFHAAAEERPVYQAAQGYWFAPLDPSDLSARRFSVDPRLWSGLEDVLVAAFRAGGEEPLPKVREHLVKAFCRGASCVSAHLRQLRARPRSLPRRLWTGSGGNVWDRMLRVAVREHGGEATVHAHAGAREYLVTPLLGFNEYFAADAFTTYTPEQARLAYAHIDERLLFGPAPRIEATVIPRRSDFWQTLVAQQPVRKIMYMSTALLGKQRLPQAPFMSDVVALDWVVRLFGKLVDWGGEVVNKAHPESRWTPPEFCTRELGATSVLKPFEVVASNADLFLFDSVATSTFPPAMMTSKPIVIVDFGQLPWDLESLKLLRRRCSYVRGWFDAENRAQVDWEALQKAIVEAPALARDTTFIRTYFES